MVTTIINELVRDVDYRVTVLMPFQNVEKKLFFIDDRIELLDLGEFKRNSGFFSKYILAFNKKSGLLDRKFFTNFIDKLFFKEKDKKHLIEFINNNNFDVVVGAGHTYSLMLGTIAPQINCKAIGWQHATCYSYMKRRGKSGYGLKNYTRSCYAKLNEVLVLTHADKEDFDRELGINSVVLYNPIPKNENMKSDVKKKSILFSGRLDRDVKGLDYLVEIIKIVVEKKPDWKFTILGDGSGKEFLIKELENNNLTKNTAVVGNTDDVYHYYCNSSILLQTSRQEGFGMTIIEAMSCGVPVVAFHNYGPDEIVRNGVDGFLINKFDVSDFADKVIMLAEDYEKRKKFSEAALDGAKRFDLNVILERFKEILNK